MYHRFGEVKIKLIVNVADDTVKKNSRFQIRFECNIVPSAQIAHVLYFKSTCLLRNISNKQIVFGRLHKLLQVTIHAVWRIVIHIIVPLSHFSV